MSKAKASELFAKLTPALGEDEARVICKGKIDKGELEDDLGAAPIIGKAELEGILELLKGSSPSPEVKAPAKPASKTSLTKGGNAEAELQVPDLQELQDQVDALIKRGDEQYTQLAKGITAIGRANTSIVTMLAEMDRRNTEFAKVADDLKKTVENMAKGAPRTVGNGGVIPHPSEGSRGAQNTASAITGNEDSSEEIKLHSKALAYCQEQIAKGGNTVRTAELQFAIGELVSGAAPAAVITKYSLDLQA